VNEPRSDPSGFAFGAEAPLDEVMRTVRAMRRLKPDPVDRELLEQLVQAAVWAPTASNVQAYTFLIVTDRAQMQALAEPWMTCFEFYRHTAVPPKGMSREAFDREMAASRFQAKHFAETPALPFATGAVTRPACRRGRTIDASAH
jgi:nitroreductase